MGSSGCRAERWACRRRQPASARASRPLPAAPDAQRSVSSQRGNTKESTSEFRRSLGEQIKYTVGRMVHFLEIA